MKIISFASEKGGCGKTTCCVNLGAALARKKKKILLFDLDGQGFLSHHLSQECEPYSRNIIDVLEGRFSIRNAIARCHQYLHIVPSTRKLAEYRETDFRKTFETIIKDRQKSYDYIFLDLPPVMSAFTMTLLSASDQVIIPVEGRGGLSLMGLAAQLQTIEQVQANWNPRLKVNGIVICRQVKRLKLCKEVEKYLHQHYGKMVYQAMISESIKIAEAASVGKSIFKYGRQTAGAKEFEVLAKEFLQRQRRK